MVASLSLPLARQVKVEGLGQASRIDSSISVPTQVRKTLAMSSAGLVMVTSNI